MLDEKLRDELLLTMSELYQNPLINLILQFKLNIEQCFSTVDPPKSISILYFNCKVFKQLSLIKKINLGKLIKSLTHFFKTVVGKM